MSHNNFGDIRVFVEVARRGGFRAAADQLQQAPASVSDAIRRFETRLGVRLFERSTRKVALTPIGEQFYEKSLPAIADLETAINELDEQKDELAGTLRLSAPYSSGPFFLDDLVARFASACPGVDVELIYDDKKVDLVTAGIDAAIRSNILLEQDTHAVPVGPTLTMSIVGAPTYLANNGEPQRPQDLSGHDAICYRFGRGGAIAPWRFTGPDGEYVIEPKPRMITNDIRSLLHYAKSGLGLAYVYAEIAAPYVAEGSLVEIFPEDLPKLPRYSLNYRSKRLMTRRLRVFVDMAKAATDLQQ